MPYETLSSRNVRTDKALVSTIVLRSLATEYLLKSLSVRWTGGFCKTHDLRELFDMLDPKIQAEITEQGDRQGIKAPDILTKRRNAFVEWRYFIEGVEHLQFGREVDLMLAALAEVCEPGCPKPDDNFEA